MAEETLPAHIIFTIVHSSLAVITLIPLGIASKPCYLGYKALCSFSPISTLVLLALAGLHVYLHKRTLAKRAA
jgi:hypothetical protein